MLLSQGVRYIILATIFFSILNALVKYLSRIPAIEIVFFRALVALVLSYIAIKRQNIKIIQKENLSLLILRGVFGAIALSLYFYTIQHMPLATAVTILYLAPIFTIIFAIFLVKEKPTPQQWPFFILCFIGVIIMKNFDTRVSIFHFSLGILAAIFAGLAYNMIRMLKGKAHHSLIIFYFPLVTIPFCLPWLYSRWIPPTGQELIFLIAVGVSTQIAQVFMTKAYLAEKASKISHYNYLTCIFAFLTGIIFFNEHLAPLSIIGLTLVIIGIFFSSKFAEAK